jgi:RING-variant domain
MQKECRICFEGESEGELISPCRCSGSSQYIHSHCLTLCRYSPGHWSKCSVCQYEYKYVVTHPLLYDILLDETYLCIATMFTIAAFWISFDIIFRGVVRRKRGEEEQRSSLLSSPFATFLIYWSIGTWFGQYFASDRDEDYRFFLFLREPTLALVHGVKQFWKYTLTNITSEAHKIAKGMETVLNYQA